MQLYVRANSKKELNERLAKGETVYGTEHTMYDAIDHALSQATHNAVIKIYSKTVHGSPYAKAYGTYSATKNRVA